MWRQIQVKKSQSVQYPKNNEGYATLRPLCFLFTEKTFFVHCQPQEMQVGLVACLTLLVVCFFGKSVGGHFEYLRRLAQGIEVVYK